MTEGDICIMLQFIQFIIAFPVICVLRRQAFARILKIHFNEKDPNPGLECHTAGQIQTYK